MSNISEVCALIKQDMEDDVARFEGLPLSGDVVAELHGNLAAAVSALAGMIAKLDERTPAAGAPTGMAS